MGCLELLPRFLWLEFRRCTPLARAPRSAFCHRDGGCGCARPEVTGIVQHSESPVRSNSCSQIHVHGGPRYLVSLRLLLVESQFTAAIRRCAAQDEAHFLTQNPVPRSVLDPECPRARLPRRAVAFRPPPLLKDAIDLIHLGCGISQGALNAYHGYCYLRTAFISSPSLWGRIDAACSTTLPLTQLHLNRSRTSGCHPDSNDHRTHHIRLLSFGMISWSEWEAILEQAFALPR